MTEIDELQGRTYCGKPLADLPKEIALEALRETLKEMQSLRYAIQTNIPGWPLPDFIGPKWGGVGLVGDIKRNFVR